MAERIADTIARARHLRDNQRPRRRRLRPGIDYDVACCPVCEGTSSEGHEACLDEIGTWPAPVWGDDE